MLVSEVLLDLLDNQSDILGFDAQEDDFGVLGDLSSARGVMKVGSAGCWLVRYTTAFAAHLGSRVNRVGAHLFESFQGRFCNVGSPDIFRFNLFGCHEATGECLCHVASANKANFLPDSIGSRHCASLNCPNITMYARQMLRGLLVAETSVPEQAAKFYD